MTTTKDALPELPEVFDTIIGLQGDGDEAEPVEWPVFTIDQVRAYALAALASKQAPTEPFWHAVVSNKSPVINKAIRREDVAQEYADQCNEQGYRDAEVVPLYLASRPAEAQDKSEPVALTEEQLEAAVSAWFTYTADNSSDFTGRMRAAIAATQGGENGNV